MSKYIEFFLVSKTTKTEVYEVQTKDDESPLLLGVIKWYSQWRQYAFFPKPETMFEKICLADITNFLKTLMDERKKNIQSHFRSSRKEIAREAWVIRSEKCGEQVP